MPVVAISNQKGGVGKTTSTLNLGAALGEAGKRVLLVDFDPQGNLSVAAGLADVDGLYPTIGDLLMIAARGKPVKGVSIDDAIQSTPAGMDLVPANGTLSAAELGLVSAMNRESALANLLKPVLGKYDYVLIDCLPSLGLLAINALRAADGVVIPVQADFLAVQGLAQIFETIAAIREQLNPRLKIYGVLPTMVDPRTTHAREVVQTVRQSLQGEVNVFQTEIRLAVVLKETAKIGRSVLDYDTSSPAADAYRSLAVELMQVAEDSTVDVVPVPRSLTISPPSSTPPIADDSQDPAGRGAPAPQPGPALATATPETPGAEPPREEAPADQGPPSNGSATEKPPDSTPPSASDALRFEEFVQEQESWLGSASQ